VEFGGFATFAYGSSIRVSGSLKIGDNFSANRNSRIACSKGIIIKEDVLTGWDISIRDADGHTITQNGIPKLSQKEVIIGKHVWICSYAHILKGVTIGDGSVVGYRATVTKPLPENNCLIVGFPAKVVQNNVEWGKFRPELEETIK
jgi:acetyltransferase-like isoleucine patch superfamily enzyme